MQNILELQSLVDDLVYFLRIITVYQCFLSLNTLFDEEDKGLGHENEHFVRHHLYSFLRNSFG